MYMTLPCQQMCGHEKEASESVVGTNIQACV